MELLWGRPNWQRMGHKFSLHNQCTRDGFGYNKILNNEIIVLVHLLYYIAHDVIIHYCICNGFSQNMM